MAKRPQIRSGGVGDDVVRTVIFVVGTGVAIYILVAFDGFLSLLVALPFLMVGGGHMRRAWFPYGKIVESAFWLVAAMVGFFLAALAKAFGAQDSGTIAVAMAILFGYSLWDTYRSIRLARQYLEMRDRAADERPADDP